MRSLPKAMFLACALAAIASVLPTAAYAAEGAVKVACGQNNCDNVTNGSVCPGEVLLGRGREWCQRTRPDIRDLRVV